MKFKAVIFDMDGVIIDSEPFYQEVQIDLFHKMGIFVPPEEYNTFIGAGMREMWNMIKSSRRLTQHIEELIKLNNNVLLEYFKESAALVPTPFFTDFLASILAAGMKTAVASSTAKPVIEVILKKLDVYNSFDIIVSGDEVENGKPAPDIFLETAARLNVIPSECAVIEDSTNGVKSAKSAGMYCLGYHNPHSGYQDISAADKIINSFAKINIDDLK
ncbi:MAG: HAD family hydrolase [Candidatus Cloacimonetes bacterium]|nr:HAD family hydrolase [Candidatus Cloacimonadota bacterium]